MAMSYEEKRARLAEEIAIARGAVRLGKETTNLFRWRADAGLKLDVRAFDQVIAVNPAEGWADVEGMTPYSALVDACLPQDVMPAVVPELKSITVGGAVSGTGLESSSFRHGFVHETVLEMDVLLADGRVVTASPESNEHRELFFALPNSYGTLGYALRVRLKTVPVKPFVRIEHSRFSDPREFFARLKALHTEPDIDFLEGVVFSEREHVISVGRMVAEAPYTSDYTYMKIYYRSLLERDEDYLTIRDYIWRWDTDWFWVSSLLGAQVPLIRRLLGRKRLNSVFYMKVRQWAQRHGLIALQNRLMRRRTEPVIQDVEIPIDNAAAFLEFFHATVGLRPIIIGPVLGSPTGAARFPFFPLDPKALYVNIGFWNGKATTHEPGHYNRLIEAKVQELKGLKMLYSDSYYDEDTFWSLYGDRDRYRALKARYDPYGKLGDLYGKCVTARATA